MASATKDLTRRGIISPPDFVDGGVQYEAIMGSTAYGCNDDYSDCDIYGFCIPPKSYTFPHTAGYIWGFGNNPPGFEQYSQHGIVDKEARKEYDITIYSIVKYFTLCMQCNPNMIDSLFVPSRCVKFASQIGQHVRENRKMFLSKVAWSRFKGYAYSQQKKMLDKNPIGRRKETIEKYGYDVKFAYHIIRLLDEVEQILIEHNIDLERNREQLKSIRRGEWTIDQITDHFTQKEKDLETVYSNSTLQWAPDYDSIRQLLINCLESHYGSLSKCVETPGSSNAIIDELRNIIKKYSI